jgi:hypothetical protein
MADDDTRIQAQLLSDWNILRSSVTVEKISDDDLKRIFVQHGCDIVQSLLSVEEQMSGLRPYVIERRELTKTERKLRRLRDIANEKDGIARQKAVEAKAKTNTESSS